jgi:hypothetical protein
MIKVVLIWNYNIIYFHIKKGYPNKKVVVKKNLDTVVASTEKKHHRKWLIVWRFISDL